MAAKDSRSMTRYPSDTGRRRALRHRPAGGDAAPARMADGSRVTNDGGRGESAADVRP
jgi:hypothetical protein